MDVLLAGEAGQAAALASALGARGLSATLADGEPSLAESLISLEALVEAKRPKLAVGVSTEEAALALAITAPKLGVPFCAWLEGADRPDERRILETLSLDGLALQEGGVAAAADRIAAWLAEAPLQRDLESGS